MTSLLYQSASDWPDDPHTLFEDWMGEASEHEPNDPNAMALACVGADMMPSVRMVLLKGHTERGFVFYTNSQSKKGVQLRENMKAALCFHWKTLRRQIRIEGDVMMLSAEESDAYFHSRPRDSQIGAWASNQSRSLRNRAEFEDRIDAYSKEYKDTDLISRPPYWNGYLVQPHCIEFWLNQEFRLHQRCVYKRHENGWDKEMLYP